MKDDFNLIRRIDSLFLTANIFNVIDARELSTQNL